MGKEFKPRPVCVFCTAREAEVSWGRITNYLRLDSCPNVYYTSPRGFCLLGRLWIYLTQVPGGGIHLVNASQEQTQTIPMATLLVRHHVYSCSQLELAGETAPWVGCLLCEHGDPVQSLAPVSTQVWSACWSPSAGEEETDCWAGERCMGNTSDLWLLYAHV